MNTLLERGLSSLQRRAYRIAKSVGHYFPIASPHVGPRGRRSRRCLRLELLESRELFARDVALDGLFAIQNTENPFDVDRRDSAIALDALLIANYLNGEPITAAALDVNGDNEISAADFASVVDYLNSTPQDVALESGAAVAWPGDSGGHGGATAAGGSKGTTYQYSVVGNAANVAVNLLPGSQGLALVGGGTDVDEVFRWMGGKANCGDFLVLRATGTNAYNPYIDRLEPCLDSVATLIIPDSASANDSFVAQTIRDAEAIFFAGGDQADYVRLWSNTPVETAIYDALARNVPIGGTSAGLAILGDYDFSALNGSILSSEALSNPYDSRITLDGGFVNQRDFNATHTSSTSLSLLTNTITDSHFQQRDRMGRLITFVARLDADGKVPDAASLGIGVNEQTALLVEPSGIGRVVGNPYSRKIAESQQQRSVFFLDTATVATTPLTSPLNFANVQIVRATYDPKTGLGDSFDLAHWTGVGVDTYSISAINGGLTSTQAGSLIY